ncbi:ParB/RepB/Spo0J family partition protein [Bengtsoniella intestinalis]|uniref:ParB/RepB/Spo0J family partition protein n=1 Tax=Bengtsoniella intestinalis TaxID=3073143 RepID=UPI00391F539F
MLQFISVDKIHPHPQNPRKELGDLTEIAASMSENGILQNLTVVPTANLRYDKEAMTWVEDETQGTQYTVIIGHRRLAAAKLAGLTEVPCVITQMTAQEQQRTMLIENIQRADLLPIEQAQGFQLMLDMGDTLEDIAQKSGFSTSTVRHRTKLLDLNQKKLKQATERGGTMSDYIALEKLEDVDRKNAVLAKIGTPNFNDVLEKALATEKIVKAVEQAIEVVSTYATQVEQYDYQTMEGYKTYGRYGTVCEVVVPDDADTAEYFYCVTKSKDQCAVYKSRSKEEERKMTAEETKKRATEERYKVQKAEAEDIAKRHESLRRAFVLSVGKTKIKNNLEVIVTAILHASAGKASHWSNRVLDNALLNTLLDIEVDETAEGEKEMVQKCIAKATLAPETTLFRSVYAMIENTVMYYWQSAYNYTLGGSEVHHKKCDRLDKTYELLTAMGYEMSDEEIAMQNGTHEIFQKEDTAECND